MTRWFVAAYRASNGNVIALRPPNAMFKYAKADVDELRALDSTNDFFVAFKDDPGWTQLDEATS